MLVETIFLRPGGLRPGGSCKAAMMVAEQSKGRRPAQRPTTAAAEPPAEDCCVLNVSCFGLHRSSRVLAHHCLLTLAGANGFRPGFCSFDAAACPQTPRFSDCSPSKHAEHKNQSDVVAYGLGCLARSRLGLARLGSAWLRKL